MKVNKKKIYNIAKENIYTVSERGDLKTLNSDYADFLEVAVWELEKALIAAYEQGRKDAENEREN